MKKEIHSLNHKPSPLDGTQVRFFPPPNLILLKKQRIPLKVKTN